VPFDPDHLDGYDGILIASPPAFHRAQLIAALPTGAKVLVEKPLSMTTDGLDALVIEGAGRVMVGFNLRLHPPVERFVRLVQTGVAGRVSAVRAWFGSWLPNWRPAVDYRTTYSARAELGGGILGDASHELDLLVWLLGRDLEVLGSAVERNGPLELDVEDTVKALMRAQDGTVAEVSLDSLSRRYRRGIEVVGEQATIRLDWARGVLEVEGPNGVDVEPTSEDVGVSYQRQAERFVAFITEGRLPPVDVSIGAASVRLAERIRDCSLGMPCPPAPGGAVNVIVVVWPAPVRRGCQERCLPRSAAVQLWV
jgi:predicted dehydrogenase